MPTMQTDRVDARTAAEAPVPHPGPVRMAIAALRNREVASMLRDDLIDLIRLSRMTAEAVVQSERLCDVELKRLAFLVRRCCRNQVDAHRCQVGQPILWRDAI